MFCVLCIAIGLVQHSGMLLAQESEVDVKQMLDAVKGQLDPNKSPVTAKELATAAELSKQVATLDWLGPLAPIALSPFFGITCLSGLAIWGPEWLPGKNTLLASSVLQNPAVFWGFLVLTVLTSVPRLTKVSKPFVQAVDRMEAYASIITLVLIKFLASGNGELQPSIPGEPLAAGIGSFSMDTLLCIAAGLNILVINSIKFFFEILVWITPLPLVDAAFEAANKIVCAALMAVYAFSPLLATLINLILFAICLVVFRWVYRRVAYYRNLISEPIMAQLFGDPRTEVVTVFPLSKWGSFPAKTKLYLSRTVGGDFQLRQSRWPFTQQQTVVLATEGQWRIRPKLLSCEIFEWDDGSSVPVKFTTAWKSNQQVGKIADHFGMALETAFRSAGPPNAKLEWA